MTKLFESSAVIKDKHLPMNIRQSLQRCLEDNNGTNVTVTITKTRKYSSDNQRAYYFAEIVEKIQFLFYENGAKLDKEETHHWLMENVGKWFKEIVTPDGEISCIRRSYVDLSTTEAEMHHELCRAWGAERGCDIKEPGESL